VLECLLRDRGPVSFDGVNDLIDKIRLHRGGGADSIPFVFVDEASWVGSL
jgi:hypothetical protein